MMNVDLERLVPQYIRADRNGYAMMKALEAGMRYFAAMVQNGIDTTLNVGMMPEWRLDEMADELGCVYDRNAAVSAKREWIQNAYTYYRWYGTARAVRAYLSGAFGQVYVQESWEYGGEPYHFRVMVAGGLNPENEKWVRDAVEKVKNLRSVLDGISSHVSTNIELTGDSEYTTMYARRAGMTTAGLDSPY